MLLRLLSWSWTRDLNSSHRSGQRFGKAIGAAIGLHSICHPQTNGQTERTNQDLEADLSCVTIAILTSWSFHLTWVGYAHNSHTSSDSNLSPFEISLFYQPSLFLAQEEELSVQDHIARYKKIWNEAQEALECSQEVAQRTANHHQNPTRYYQPG